MNPTAGEAAAFLLVPGLLGGHLELIDAFGHQAASHQEANGHGFSRNGGELRTNSVTPFDQRHRLEASAVIEDLQPHPFQPDKSILARDKAKGNELDSASLSCHRAYVQGAVLYRAGLDEPTARRQAWGLVGRPGPAAVAADPPLDGCRTESGPGTSTASRFSRRGAAPSNQARHGGGVEP